MPAADKSFTFIPNTDIDVDSPITDILKTSERDNDEFNLQYIGGGNGGYTPDLLNIAHDHDGINSAITVGELVATEFNSTQATTTAAVYTTLATIVLDIPVGVVVRPNTYDLFALAVFDLGSVTGPGGNTITEGRIVINGTVVNSASGTDSTLHYHAVYNDADLPVTVLFQARRNNANQVVSAVFKEALVTLFKKT